MKKPTDEMIVSMSKTAKGAIDAAILKWEWLCQAPVRSVKSTNWPFCGLCEYYKDNCSICPLRSCHDFNSPHGLVLDKLIDGRGTLAEFRIAAKKMLERIKEI